MSSARGASLGSGAWRKRSPFGPPRRGGGWKPFQLNPSAPKGGLDRQAYRVRKFGSLAYSQQLEARVAAAGAEEEIEFHFDQIKRTPNTMEAHRLIWFAGREQGQDGPNVWDVTTVQNAGFGNPFRAYMPSGNPRKSHRADHTGIIPPPIVVPGFQTRQ